MVKAMMLGASFLVACGNIKAQAPDATPAPDAAPIDGTPSACDLQAAFGAPQEVTGLSAALTNEWAARFSPDQLVAYLGNDSAGGSNRIYTASRTSVGDSFGALTELTALTISGQQSGAAVTADGLTVYFHTDATTGSAGGYDIFTSTRASTAAVFSAPSPVANINTANDESNPYVTPDGSTLYFGSNKDIYVATLGLTGFDTPTIVAGVSTGADEDAPVVTPDQLTIYFARHVGADVAQIMVAHRTTTSDGFGTPVPVTALDTDGLDFPMWVSDDGCTLYLLSNGQQAGDGSLDVFVASHGG